MVDATQKSVGKNTMGRLIEVQNVQALPPSLTLRVGDLLIFGATGGHVQSGADIVEILGPFFPGVMGNNGKILSPIGAPNAVMFLARRPGRAMIDVVIGDRWYTSQIATLEMIVES
ncbi:MAG: hypothetical protein RMY34_25855 [Aulosira sp. DedQUE10]|nr:hypothetical protein [Aulosira sp. DedQUE10]